MCTSFSLVQDPEPQRTYVTCSMIARSDCVVHNWGGTYEAYFSLWIRRAVKLSYRFLLRLRGKLGWLDCFQAWWWCDSWSSSIALHDAASSRRHPPASSTTATSASIKMFSRCSLRLRSWAGCRGCNFHGFRCLLSP